MESHLPGFSVSSEPFNYIGLCLRYYSYVFQVFVVFSTEADKALALLDGIDPGSATWDQMTKVLS